MFTGIVNGLVERLTPLLTHIGDTVCARTPGLINQWPTYEFMCRNTGRLAELTIEHVILTLVAMVIAILLGVLIGVRVSTPPWPERSSRWFWPVLGLVAASLVVGVLAAIALPEDTAEIARFNASNVTTWGHLLGADAALGSFGVLALIQSALMLGLAAVLAAGVLPGGTDLRIVGAALAGAVVLPAVLPRPILHILLLQLYQLARVVGLGSGLLNVLAGLLNFVRDAAPLWALIALVALLGGLSKRVTWRSYVAAALAGYVMASLLSIFVVKPGGDATALGIQVALFAIFAVLVMLGEKAADPALYIVGVIFTIPSLAMFGIMIPIIGIGVDPAIIALVLYGLLPILRNTITALHELDPAYTESGRGMGMTDLQLLTKVQLPLALPVILAGVRVSTVMTVGIASIATLIGAGGLGELIFQGINRTQARMVLTGAIWIALLALAFDFILGQGEIRWISKGIRPDTGDQTIQDVQEAAGL
jgi:osmoprotectant transport system permease protein